MGKPTTVLLIALAALALGFTFPQATQDYPDAVTADPDHYSVEFENDAVRVIRIKYGPGERSVLHYHPANCFVLLSEGTWRMTDAMGEVTEVPSRWERLHVSMLRSTFRRMLLATRGKPF